MTTALEAPEDALRLGDRVSWMDDGQRVFGTYLGAKGGKLTLSAGWAGPVTKPAGEVTAERG